MCVLQDHLFATTGHHMQFVVFDRLNASRILAAIDMDATLHDVTILDDVNGNPSHGRVTLF